MTYLITGGAGFLGINLIRYLLRRGHDVRSLDLASFDYPEAGRVTAVQGDIRDRDLVGKAMEGVTIVVHCPSTGARKLSRPRSRARGCCWKPPWLGA
jgi:nucleoside-diphosphate-sugar epimerase